ncbi:hypothetical protein WA171_002544 [Blastocystis sp. BT1]
MSEDTGEPIQEEKTTEQESGIRIEEIIDEEIVRDLNKAVEFKEEGNRLFKKGDYTSAVQSYKMSLRYCPLEDEYNKDRAIFMGNMAAAQIELKQYEDAIESASQAIQNNPSYVKAYIRRSQAYLETDKLDECLADYDKILELDKSMTSYRSKRQELAKRIDERNEKLKQEMLGKLKEVGNKILGKFGMSVDNFKMVQDPATGGYSIKYEKWLYLLQTQEFCFGGTGIDGKSSCIS